MTTFLKRLVTGARLGGKLPIETIHIGRSGDPKEIILHKGKIYVYNSQGQALISGGLISANAILARTITATSLSIGGKKFSHTINFTPVDEDTASWSTGSIYFADGTTRYVNAGNTGNITQKTYIYYASSATLRKTKQESTAVGGNNIPLAIVEPASDADTKCIITSFLTGDTTIDGDLITTGRIESGDGKTYFDLNEDRLVVYDGVTNRIVIGYVSSGVYGIKVSLQGYDAITDTNIRHFTLWALSTDATDNVLIKEKTRGSVSISTSSSQNVAHGLSNVPFCIVFYEKTTGVYQKLYGSPYGIDDAYFIVNGTNLTMYNYTGSTKTFKYYIFYDQMTT